MNLEPGQLNISGLNAVQERIRAIQSRMNELQQQTDFGALLNSAIENTGNNTAKSTSIPENPAMLNLIESQASKNGVDPNLAKALVSAESGFNPNAVSKVGAQGLMQLMPQTADGLGVDNPFDPAQNVDGGTRYLKSLMDKYHDLPKAVAAYNAGPGAVDKYNGIPPYAETQAYTKRVIGLYERYSGNNRGVPQ